MVTMYDLTDVFLLGLVVILPVAFVVIMYKWYQGDFNNWEQD
jgi:hypothetical protein